MKSYKIQLCLSSSPDMRAKMVSKMGVDYGFARTKSAIDPILIQSFDELEATHDHYFVLAVNADLTNPTIYRHLARLSLHGIFVCVGSTKAPKDTTFCDVLFPENLFP